MDTVYVLFFKQKTAYEMRISDWSSDVCSSDLEQGSLEGEIGAVGDPRRGLAVGDGAVLADLASGGAGGVADGGVGQAEHGELADGEIGRASCRERVGQSV